MNEEVDKKNASIEKKEDAVKAEERKKEKKAKRSLASVRAKNRMGKKPSSLAKNREKEAFFIEQDVEKQEEKSKVPPQKMLAFWENFQKRQHQGMKMAGVSTTGYKITNVQMLFDKNGKEQGVKISFAGGGSVKDMGDKIHVFHNIRRKKPRFNKLYALLQAIKEKGWKAVVADIPPEMRPIVFRACKRAGIPLRPRTETVKVKSVQQTKNNKNFASLEMASSSLNGDSFSLDEPIFKDFFKSLDDVKLTDKDFDDIKQFSEGEPKKDNDFFEKLTAFIEASPEERKKMLKERRERFAEKGIFGNSTLDLTKRLKKMQKKERKEKDGKSVRKKTQARQETAKKVMNQALMLRMKQMGR